MKKIRKTAKRICAIQAEVPAIPPNPNIPAIIAITRNIKAHERNNIGHPPFQLLSLDPVRIRLAASVLDRVFAI
jgi:hypothetical protein